MNHKDDPITSKQFMRLMEDIKMFKRISKIILESQDEEVKKQYDAEI